VKRLPIDDVRHAKPPASPLVEATLSQVHDLVRTRYDQSGQAWNAFALADNDRLLSRDDFNKIEACILASGHRFDWSAAVSVKERPEAYKAADGAEVIDTGFAHPDAPMSEAGENGYALRGIGDNVVRHDRDVSGTARYIRSNDRVLAFLNEGVPPETIAVIDDSGGTLTAPIIEQFAGVICAGGTVRSHLGILSREYNIPCLMNAKIAGIKDGDMVVIEASADARKTEDYQQGIERPARIWLATRGAGQ
jgi:phosphohistidine swiveling domain-containing protein